MRIMLLLPLLAGLGCGEGPDDALRWHDDLKAAIREAATTNRPLMVVSLVGDLRKRC